MPLTFRETQPGDIDAQFSVRERTRQSPIPREYLASIGITPASTAEGLESGKLISWVCDDGGTVVGFCSGDRDTGEVLVLAVLPDYEGMGVGRRLLGHVVDALRDAGHARLWLAAAVDPAVRAHGFYRALGWRPTGEIDRNGDEILVLEQGHQDP